VQTAHLSRGDWDILQENHLGGWVGSEKPDRSWGVWEFRSKVRNKVIKVIHPEGEGYKAEPLFWGRGRHSPSASSSAEPMPGRSALA